MSMGQPGTGRWTEANQIALEKNVAQHYFNREMSRLTDENSYGTYDERRQTLHNDYSAGRITPSQYAEKSLRNDLLQRRIESGLSDREFIGGMQAIEAMGKYPTNTMIATPQRSNTAPMQKAEDSATTEVQRNTAVAVAGLSPNYLHMGFIPDYDQAKKEATEQMLLERMANNGSIYPPGSLEADIVNRFMSALVSVAQKELAIPFKEKQRIKTDPVTGQPEINPSTGKVKTEGDNKTKYGKWWGQDGEAWCDVFVAYCAAQAGIPKSVIPWEAAVVNSKAWYEDRNRYKAKETGHIPKAGDTIFFLTKDKYHIGIVIAYDPQTHRVYTIEGNSGDQVSQRDYNINEIKSSDQKHIIGYGANGGTSYGIMPGTSSSNTSDNTR